MNNLKWENIKGKKYAIHCPTQELGNRVMDFIVLMGGRDLRSNWNINHTNTGWYLEDFPSNSYCRIDWFKTNGDTIISAEDFLRANTENKLCLNYLIL